jgi:DNA-binding MarR family transcriptional regulator
MAQDPAAYADSVAFLLSQLGALSAQRFAERLSALDVSPRAFGVLSNVALGESPTQQQLADALGIHRNNMVSLVDEMEAAGWLRRERGVEDRRTFHLRLTAKGRELVDRVNQLVPELDAELTAGLSAAQRDKLARRLAALARTLDLSPTVHPHLSSRPR